MQRALRYLALPGPTDWICCYLPLLRADTKSGHSDCDHAALAPAFMKTLFNRSPHICPMTNHNVQLADSLVSGTTMSSEGLKSVWQLHHHCFYVCFWSSWAWNNDTELLYSIQCCIVKYRKAQLLVEDACMWHLI